MITVQPTQAQPRLPVQAPPKPAELPQEPSNLSASQKRALQPLLIPTWSVQALLSKLPLAFPIEPDLPPSPKACYRSQYRYLGPDHLLDPDRLANLTDLQIALHLIDFSPLEPLLARIYVPSLKGQVPFHPVSMFLAVCLRREKPQSWVDLARLLAGEDGPSWRRLFGFGDGPGQTPSASGLRYFFDAVGPEVFDDLCPRSVALLRQHGLFPETSTYPGDSREVGAERGRGITVTQDGMLHRAKSRPSCELAEDSCYQPLSPTEPAPTEPAPTEPAPTEPAPTEPAPTEPAPSAARPCRARQRALPGCNCDSPTCQEQCQRASRLDPEARFIHYAGHNHKHADKRVNGNGDNAQAKAPTARKAKPDDDRGPSQGINLFGYRSVVDRAIDDRFAVAWNLQSTLYSANTDERTIFVKRLKALVAKYPDLPIGEWLDDSGVGYGPCLEAIYELGALRMVDIRADKGDSDPTVCLKRGYDGQGCPLCPHGYRLRSNGHDYERRRTKYVCAQVCRREPLRDKEPIAPVKACPFLGEPGCSSLGYVVNVGKTLPDGSIRLAREIPYGSPTWKARYGRRNLSESRNGQIEGMGLKRMKSYGLARNTKDVQLADFLINLRTIGRLVREASKLRVT